MKFIHTIVMFANKLFLLLPFVLCSIFAGVTLYYGMSQETYSERLLVWKLLRNPIYYFFLPWPLFILVDWIENKDRTVKTFFSSFKNWIIGLVLTLFSFAIVSLLLDVLFVVIVIVKHFF